MNLDLLYDKVSNHNLFIAEVENIEKYIKSEDYPGSFGLKFSNSKFSGEIFYYAKKTPFIDIMIIENESLKTLFKVIQSKEENEIFDFLYVFLDNLNIE